MLLANDERLCYQNNNNESGIMGTDGKVQAGLRSCSVAQTGILVVHVFFRFCCYWLVCMRLAEVRSQCSLSLCLSLSQKAEIDSVVLGQLVNCNSLESTQLSSNCAGKCVALTFFTLRAFSRRDPPLLFLLFSFPFLHIQCQPS